MSCILRTFIPFLIAIIGFTISTSAATSCHWHKVRGSYWVTYDSNLVNPMNVQDCFYSIKKPVVLLENFEDGHEFEGTVYLQDKDTKQVLESCPTRTVAGLNPFDEFDVNRVNNFIKDVQASGDGTGDTTTKTEKWQNYFNSKIAIDCD